MLLVFGNLFFFRPVALVELPIIDWILISLLVGGLVGFWLNILLNRVARDGAKLGRWFFLSCLAAFWIVFGMTGIFYAHITPNSFSKTIIQVIPAPPPVFPPEDPRDLGVVDQIIVNTIRVDHQKIDINTACQIVGAPAETSSGTISLKNTVGAGIIQCTLYPLNEVSFDFDTLGQSFSSELVIDHQFHYQKGPSAHDDATILIDTWYLFKTILPNLVRYFTATLILWILALCLTFLRKKTAHRIVDLFRQIPPIAWVLAGGLICYLAFYVLPNFFIWDYVKPYMLTPADPKANDFTWLMETTRSVILEGHVLQGSFYVPDSFVLFVPFALLNYALSLHLFTIINIGIFIITTFVLPVLAFSKKHTNFALFFVMTGLISFGMQFELARGQWYSLVYGLLIFSLWLFHRYYDRRWVRWIAYGLFCIAVQMKLTPALFVFLFIKDWRDIRGNLIRIYSLGIVNVLLIFLTGFSNARAFINSILAVSKVSGSYCWFGNHSIASLVVLAQAQSFINLSNANAPLTLAVIICIGLLLYRAFRTKKSLHPNGMDPFLLIGFTLAVLLIPSENNDYTLVALPMVLSIAINMLLFVPEYRVDGIDLLVISFFYTMTLISYDYKAGSLISLTNCIPLLFILIYLTVIAMRSRNANLANSSGSINPG
jgi:hypothetical protein